MKTTLELAAAFTVSAACLVLGLALGHAAGRETPEVEEPLPFPACARLNGAVRLWQP